MLHVRRRASSVTSSRLVQLRCSHFLQTTACKLCCGHVLMTSVVQTKWYFQLQQVLPTIMGHCGTFPTSTWNA